MLNSLQVKTLTQLPGKDKTGKPIPPIQTTSQQLNPQLKDWLKAGAETNHAPADSIVPEELTHRLNNAQQRAIGIDTSPGASAGATDDRVIPNTVDNPDDYAPLPGNAAVEPTKFPDTSGPNVNVTPSFEPTGTDQTIAYAKAALNANPDARDEILRRLQGMGIDPSSLDEAA